MATYTDIEALPDHVVGELIDGELIVSPRPAGPHTVASSDLGALISGPFRFGIGGPGGWWILDEPELHFRRDVLVPDIAGWRSERLTKLDVPFFTIAPDWLCEVLSPSTERVDRLRKLRIYARRRVAHVWLVDPLLQTLEVLELRDGVFALIGAHGGAEVVRARPFDAIELPLALLWGGSPTPGSAPKPTRRRAPLKRRPTKKA